MKTMNNNNIENVKNRIAANSKLDEVTVNESMGWKIEKVIPFSDGFNHYIKSHMELDEAVDLIAQEIGIKPEDKSEWAEKLRKMIRGYVEHFDFFTDDEYFHDAPGDPDSCNRAMTDMMCDAIIFESECVDPYYGFE